MDNELDASWGSEKTYSAQILRTMNDFRKEGVFCDATIKVNGRIEYWVHRAILAASSRYFRKLFTYSSPQKITHEVELDWLCPDDIEILLQYIYTGEVELCKDKAEMLIASSGYLVIDSLRERSVEFLLENLNAFNCSSTLSLADQYGCRALKHSCTQFLRRNIAQASMTPAFQCLQRHLVRDAIIRDDDCVTVNPEEAFVAMIRWIKYDLANRRIHFENLFTCLPFTLISKDFLLETVSREMLVQESVTCSTLVSSAIQAAVARHTGENVSVTGERLMSPRDSVTAVIVCGGTSSRYVTLNSKSTLGFIPSLDKWVELTGMPNGRKGHATTVCNGDLYCLGNHSAFEHESSRQVQLFNSTTNTWTLSSPMPSGRCFHAAVTLFGQLYVLGGYLVDGYFQETTSRVSRYNPVLDRWYPVAPMNCTRHGLCAVVLDGVIFAIGGCDLEENCLKTVEKYDLTQDRWKFTGAMVHERCFACAVVLKGKILVVGGRKNAEESGILGSCEEYDPQTNAWTVERDALCTPRCAAGIATFSSNVYVFGGEGEDDALDDVERWDAETRSWTIVSKIPFSVSHLQSQVMNLSKQLVS